MLTLVSLLCECMHQVVTDKRITERKHTAVTKLLRVDDFLCLVETYSRDLDRVVFLAGN